MRAWATRQGKNESLPRRISPPTHPCYASVYIPCVDRTEHISNIEPFEREPARGPSDKTEAITPMSNSTI